MNLLSSKTATQRGARPVHRAEARRRRVSVAVFACRVEARRRRSVSPNTSACPSASSLRNSVRSAIFIKLRLNERSSRLGTASSKTAVAFINRSKSHDPLPNPQFPHPIAGYCSLFTPIVAFLAPPGVHFFADSFSLSCRNLDEDRFSSPNPQNPASNVFRPQFRRAEGKSRNKHSGGSWRATVPGGIPRSAVSNLIKVNRG